MSLLPRTKRERGASFDPASPETPAVLVGDNRIAVEVVSTHAAIQKGLSGRRSLPESYGMLFIFDHSAQFRFWMRHMHFPLDMIWISEDRRIVDITKNVPPLPFFSKPIFYSPTVMARYVLEVRANYCDTHGISVGQSVEFISV